MIINDSYFGPDPIRQASPSQKSVRAVFGRVRPTPQSSPRILWKPKPRAVAVDIQQPTLLLYPSFAALFAPIVCRHSIRAHRRISTLEFNSAP